MQCSTIKGYQGNKAIFAPKKKFYTLEAAQCNADFINKGSKVFIKRAAYKCHVCGHYHVGKTNDMIPNKTPKRSYGLKIMKVVGHVDLTQFETKKKNKIGVQVAARKRKPKKKEHRFLKIDVLLNSGLIWKVEFKEKILKVITDEGRIRHISLLKIYSPEEVKKYDDGVKLLQKKALDYLNKKEYSLR